jgi:signal transduction histidine kinase
MQVRAVNFSKLRSTVAGLLLALLLLSGIGFLDYITGEEISFSISYLAAVGVAAWFGGRSCGVLISGLGAVVWLVTERLQGVHYSQAWIQYWNAFALLGFFLIISLLVFQIKALTSNFKGIVRQRTTALASEIAVRQRLEHEILSVTELERERVGQDLHDGVAQDLVGVACAVNLLERRLKEKSLPEAARVREISELIDHTLTAVRKVARGLYPVTLEGEGLAPALEELCGVLSHSFKVDCRLDCPERATVTDPAIAVHLYRIAQEAANNAIRHGRARQIVIGLRARDGKFKLTVSDNGLGIAQPIPQHNGMGLRIIRYRAHRIGATLNIDRRPEGGMLVAAELNRSNGTSLS